jgi:hypothetical protein
MTSELSLQPSLPAHPSLTPSVAALHRAPLSWLRAVPGPNSACTVHAPTSWNPLRCSSPSTRRPARCSSLFTPHMWQSILPFTRKSPAARPHMCTFCVDPRCFKIGARFRPRERPATIGHFGRMSARSKQGASGDRALCRVHEHPAEAERSSSRHQPLCEAPCSAPLRSTPERSEWGIERSGGGMERSGAGWQSR